MKCPKCSTSTDSLYTDITADRARPAICKSCGANFYVRRFLSAIITHGVVGSGLIFIALFFSFGKWGWLGIVSTILISSLLWVVLAKMEGEILPVNELTQEMVVSGNKYLFATRLVVIGFIALVVYVLFF